MNENQNKVVELHKHIISAMNLARDIYNCAEVDFTHACEDEHLVVNLFPLIQNAVEEMLEVNDIYCLQNVVNGNLTSDYYEKAEFDPNTKKEDKNKS